MWRLALIFGPILAYALIYNIDEFGSWKTRIWAGLMLALTILGTITVRNRWI